MGNRIIEDIKSSIRNENPVTRLIIINVAVFLIISALQILWLVSARSMFMSTLKDVLVFNLSMPMSFARFLHRPWTLLTHIFTQEKLPDILWNMLALFWFGKLLAYYTAAKKIIPLYIMGGIVGGLVSILAIETIPVFHGYTGQSLIGASAGVTAIIVATATLIPDVKMNLFLIGPVKLLYVSVFVIFISVLNMASDANVSGNISHLGGAAMGYSFIVQYKKGRDMSKWFNQFFDWVRGLFKRSPKSKMKVAHKRAVPANQEYNLNRREHQQTVDEILDKISKSGYESLSKAEKDILFKASNKI
jgi:membrane associated rhomboid family serine protease